VESITNIYPPPYCIVSPHMISYVCKNKWIIISFRHIFYSSCRKFIFFIHKIGAAYKKIKTMPRPSFVHVFEMYLATQSL
jgi:hypothetical protein